jgi:hypothetical protein
VESPDSAQPYPPHAGSRSSVPLRFCPGVRKVSALVGEAVEVAGEEAGAAGEEAGAAGEEAGLVGVVPGALWVLTVLGVPEDEAEDAAELVEELQAVNSTAIQASEAQAATCQGLGAFVILMMSKPYDLAAARRANAMSGSASHVTSTTLAAALRLERDCTGLIPRPVRHK